MAREHDFRELKKTYTASTVDGTKTYGFPTNYKTIYDIRLIDGSSSLKLEHSQGQIFDQMVAYPENQSEGRPSWYIPYGNSFDLYPIPGAAYVMYCRCTIWPTQVTAVTDLVTFNSDKDDLLVFGMTSELFSHIQMHEDAAVWEAKFKQALKDAIDLDGKYPDWNPVGMGFDFTSERYVGDPWKDPFQWGNP
jgi:hypothetical protein